MNNKTISAKNANKIPSTISTTKVSRKSLKKKAKNNINMFLTLLQNGKYKNNYQCLINFSIGFELFLKSAKKKFKPIHNLYELFKDVGDVTILSFNKKIKSILENNNINMVNYKDHLESFCHDYFCLFEVSRYGEFTRKKCKRQQIPILSLLIICCLILNECKGNTYKKISKKIKVDTSIDLC
ncbi:MAG: hypothetical protein Ta2E_02140 [Mycoplasmoidaceae bacterium]|nr:MAG: hypothetical protein Ta2E_02140 [Mycoplasmoidaceae bacterium]